MTEHHCCAKTFLSHLQFVSSISPHHEIDLLVSETRGCRIALRHFRNVESTFRIRETQGAAQSPLPVSRHLPRHSGPDGADPASTDERPGDRLILLKYGILRVE